MSFVIYPLICASAAGIVLVAARLLRLRYSLRSLAIFVLLAGSCEALCIDWGPWRCEETLRGPKAVDGHSTSLSPDGRRIVAASSDRTARVCDSSTGEELATLKGHTDFVFSVLFSPDGKRIVTAGHDGTARVWNSTSGEELAVLKGHTAPVYSALFSSDGKRILTASGDRTAQVWDSTSGKQLALLKGHTAAVVSASFSADGNCIVTISHDGTARIWRRTRPEWWWGIFYMLEFWFSAGFAVALVWSLLADRRTFARMDAEAAASRRSDVVNNPTT